MHAHQGLRGVFAAALTPLGENGEPELADLVRLLEYLASRGCHGALLLGTTGEGPSFAANERIAIWKAAADFSKAHPDFRLLAGTSTPSLEETIQLTRAAFDSGMDGVVVLPPYYYRKVSQDGLFTWFSHVLERATPEGGALFGYHIPGVSGVPLSLELLARLKDAFPARFAGIKDSSSDPKFAHQLGEQFGDELLVYNGNDRLFQSALRHAASGCITAMANIVSPALRQVWDSYLQGKTDPAAQAKLEAARELFDKYPPAPPLLKALFFRQGIFPRWRVRPPLEPLAQELERQAFEDAQTIFEPPPGS